jgi:hypothetical protein
MAVGKDTGPGKIAFDGLGLDPLNPFPVKSYLFHNFNFDGDELKDEHVKAIEIHLLPRLLKTKQVIRISGHASRIGDPKYNQELSARRARSIRAFLSKKGVTDAQMPWDELRARGEYDSTSLFDDDQLDRSVKVEILPDYKPRPKPRRPIPNLPGKPTIPAGPPPLPEEPDIFIPPIRIPPDIEWSDRKKFVLRRVFVKHVFRFSEGIGDRSGKLEHGPWKLVREEFTEAPWTAESDGVRKKKSFRFFIGLVRGILNQREEYHSQSNVYSYSPEASPREAADFELPDDEAACKSLYSGGRVVTDLS